MVHSAFSIALLLAAFDVALPSEREKPGNKANVSVCLLIILVAWSAGWDSEPEPRLSCN